MVQKLGRTKIVFNVRKICATNDIITVQNKQISRTGNNTNKILEMNQLQRELEARRLKATKKKNIHYQV